MLKSIASVITGYLAMAAVVMIGTIAAAAAMIPGGLAAARALEGQPPRNYLYANLALSIVAGVLGGWVTARMAPGSPLAHAAALAALMLVMSVVSAKSQARKQPSWYPWTIAAIGIAGVLIGASWETSYF